MKTFSEYIIYREGDGESGFSLNGYFHTTPKMGHGVYPRITCKDGFNMSVQASSFAYSKPRSDEPPYTHVEVGYPSEHESLLDPYADGESKDVFGYVPVEVVEKIVDKHGFKGASTRAQNQAESRYVKENLEIEDKSRQKKEEIIKKFFVKDLTGRGYSTEVEGDRVLALYDEDSFEESFEEFEDWVKSSEVGDEIRGDMRITRIA